jgi:hypothetical protein
MSFDKFWMIAEVSQAETSYDGEMIPRDNAPRFMHPELEQAETQLLKLQKRHPHKEFVLMEAIARAKEKYVFVVEPITTDEIPF